MISEKLLEMPKNDGVVAIATLGKDGPHMVNTWNTYIPVSPRRAFPDSRRLYAEILKTRLSLWAQVIAA